MIAVVLLSFLLGSIYTGISILLLLYVAWWAQVIFSTTIIISGLSLLREA